MKRNHVRGISVHFRTPVILVVLALAPMICVGCGGDSSAPEAPTGSELEQFLEENPDIDSGTEEFDGDYE